MIFTEIKKHPVQYVVLVILLLSALVAFLYFSYDPFMQRRVLYFTAALYFLWSLFHHYQRGDLQVSILLEYLLIALLGVILISSTLF